MACSGAQKPLRARGSNKCPLHAKEVIYVCETCDELACPDCATKQHKGHELEGLSVLIPEVRQKLQDLIRTTEQNDIPRIQEELKTVNNDLTTSEKHYQEQISKLRDQNAALKKELDDISEKYVKSYRDMEQEDADILKRNRDELLTKADEFDSRIREVRDVMQSTNTILMYDVYKDISSKSKKIPKPERPSPAQYTPKRVSPQELKHLFGDCNISKRCYQSVETSTYNQEVWSFKQEFCFWEFKQRFDLSFDLENGQSIHACKGDQVWVRSVSKCEILQVNQRGKIKERVKSKDIIQDFDLCQRTNKIWCLCNGKVSEVNKSGGTYTFLVKFEPYYSNPLCICMTSDDHVVLGHNCQLVKYTKSGKRLSTTPGGGFFSFSSPAVIHPFRISECPVTGNLAVVDLDSKSYGGKDIPIVTIFSDKLQKLYSYQGDGSSPQTECPFDPCGICYTGRGELVVTDTTKYSVLLLDSEGKFLQTLNKLKTIHAPLAACAYGNDTVYISFNGGAIHVFERI